MEKVKIIRSNRKSLGIYINSDGEVLARAPHYLTQDVIYDFISKKSDWINKTRAEILLKRAKKFSFSEGEELYYLGKGYKLTFSSTKVVRLNEDRLELPYECNAREEVTKFLLKEARKILFDILSEESQRLNIPYVPGSLTQAKTRWASCSGKNRINISYRLLHCPEYVIRHVCVHELCHVVYKNHGSGFKNMLKKLSPCYERGERFLKTEAKTIPTL